MIFGYIIREKILEKNVAVMPNDVTKILTTFELKTIEKYFEKWAFINAVSIVEHCRITKKVVEEFAEQVSS